MPDALDKIGQSIADFASGKHETIPYYHLEPYNIAERPRWILDLARDDGVDLHSEEILKHFGKDPHEFQVGYLMSCKRIRALIGPTQGGKSLCWKTEVCIMHTGEIPIALRYDKGVDSGVKRIINKGNILRFGRRDAITGEIIDYDFKAQNAESWKEWDCGNITGCGKYPVEKIAPVGSESWLCTFMQGIDSYWWPSFADINQLWIPEHCIDRSRGNKGFDVTKKVVYLIRGTKIKMISYESGPEKVEEKKVHSIGLDEEPIGSDAEQWYDGALTHCHYLSLLETPYQGITWSRGIFMPSELSPEKDVFHGTKYDCPFLTKEEVDVERNEQKPWVRAARIWGIPAESHGEPYYDRRKLQKWYDTYDMHFDWKRFVPAESYFDMVKRPEITDLPGLIDVAVNIHDAQDDDQCSTWRVYELPRENVAYFIPADPAEGAETPEEAADVCAAGVMRLPNIEKGEDPDRPVICASLASTLQTEAFARELAYAARVYNNALLCAETRRHASNAIVAQTLKRYPYWYRFSSVNDRTRKQQEKIGFDTNAATRISLFKLAEAWFNSFDENEYPKIPDRPILKEAIECIVGKNGRPDHPKRTGTLDRLVWFGIGLYVYNNSREQIRCRVKPKPNELRGIFQHIFMREQEVKPVFPGDGLQAER